MTPPLDLPLGQLAPPPSLFTHASTIHGQAHVSRVMVHAFRLIAATGRTDEAPRLWAAVYLHDLARTHDGRCHRHGADAMKKFENLPGVRALFARAGVTDDDYAVIDTAVVHHSVPKELDRAHPHWRLTSLVMDADALDGVRIGDLDQKYLRNPEAQTMVEFAERLFAATDGVIPTGDDHFEQLWPAAVRLAQR
jgi:hypothetical protein